MLIKGIKVGNTDVISTYTDNISKSDNVNLTVTPLNVESIDVPTDTIYTGGEIRPNPPVYAIINDVRTQIEEGVDFDFEYSNNVNVGFATISAVGKGNFTGVVSTNWRIAPADIVVNSNDKSIVYNGNYIGDPIVVETIGGQDVEVMYGRTVGNYNLATHPTIKNVLDSGTIYYKVIAPNHNDFEGYYTLTIEPKLATLFWGDTTWVYDGDEHFTTCDVTNLVDGDTCDVCLSGNSITQIGNTQVEAISLSNSNYKLPDVGTVAILVVSPGLFINASNSWTPVKKVYKKISGRWERIEYKDMNSAFGRSGTLYVNRT